jgi:hypothetical protein
MCEIQVPRPLRFLVDNVLVLVLVFPRPLRRSTAPTETSPCTHNIASASSSQQAARRSATRGSKLLLGLQIQHQTPSPPKPISRTPSRKADEPFVCQICFNNTPDLPSLTLDCEHTFARDRAVGKHGCHRDWKVVGGEELQHWCDPR